jgi:ketosteroid isomerase-like protein
MAPDRAAIARACYAAYETGERQALDESLAEDFEFWSPEDEGIDRATYFERCWPNHGHLEAFGIVRLVETGDEVVVTYEATRTNGTRFRNTEVLTFDGDDRVTKVEVYFGWTLPD